MFSPVRTCLVLFGCLVVPSGSAKTQECSCGYGGACMRDGSVYSPAVADVGCAVCELISGGFYENCSDIVDHCKSSTCENNGTCRSTWGSYFCDCLPGYFGQNCSIYEPSLTRIGLSNEVYAYHQIQPNSDGISTFHIIYDPGTRGKTVEDYEIVPVVAFSDHRTYYPSREEQFKLKNIKKLCHAEASANEEMYDVRICGQLPDGEVWTFTFDATLYGHQPNVYDNKWGPIGVRGTLRFEIQIISRTYTYNIFNETYTIFTYTKMREPYKCLIDIYFGGCDLKRKFPRRYSRAHPLKITAIKEVQSCNGTMPVGFEWYRQKNVLRQKNFEFDEVPKLIEGHDPDTAIHIPAYYFEAGVHMIQFAYILRGDPPHYGSEKVFKLFSQCWIEILQNTPWFETFGGRQGTVPCHHALELKVQSMEPSFRTSEFRFKSTCNDTQDAECSLRELQGNILKKLRTPCDTHLNFTIVASHRQNQVPDVKFWTTAHFIESDTNFIVECLCNCDGEPIDPSYRVVISAQSKPRIDGMVNWTVLANGAEIEERDGEFDHVFHNSTASRIIRMNGYRFKVANEAAPEVRVTMERSFISGASWHATYFSYGDNLEFFLKHFTLKKLEYGKNNYIYQKTSTTRSYLWQPLKYRIYSVFEKLGAFALKAVTTYEERLIFVPSSSMSQICLLDSFFTEICSELTEVQFEKREVTLHSCAVEAQGGDYDHFMDLAITFLTNNLYTHEAKNMEWKIPVEVHIFLLDLMAMLQNQQNLKAYEQHTMMFMIQMLNLFFYSNVGCENLNMFVPFKNRTLNGLRSLSAFVQMRDKAKSVLRKTIKLFDEYSKNPNFKLLRCPLGDPIEMMVRAWTLAYLSDDVGFQPEEPKDFATLYLLGEVTYWIKSSSFHTLNLLLYISPSMSRLSHSFEGLRTTGTERVRVWMTRCTYKCILTYLNKSEPVSENYAGYIDHLFVPLNKSSDSKTGRWMIPIDFELPDTFIPGWEHMIFSLVVWVAKSRPLDEYWTPGLHVELRDEDDNLITHMPNGLSYNVSLPPIIKGNEIEAERLFYSRYTFEQPVDPSRRPKCFVAFKITLPINMKSWNFTVFALKNHHLKGKAYIEEAPNYNEVAQSPEWKGHPGSLGAQVGFTFSTVLLPEDGKDLRDVYLGLMLAESEPPGIYHFFIQSKFAVCLIRDLFKGYQRCEGIRGDAGGERKSIQCRCKQFGITYGLPFPVDNLRLLMDEITLVAPNRQLFAGAIIGIVMVISVAIFPLTAWLLEKRREAKASFVFLDNEYPKDTYRMVIGVHTGMNLLAGTSSDVVIRLIGRSGSSRVFVLRTRRHKKMLTWGSDYWFIVNTSPSLGKITHVMIWHDFRYLSDWYCSHIMIHDHQTSLWYYVTVKRWFQIYPSDDESRMVILPVEEFKELEEDLEEVEKSFNTYYFKELRNTHLPFCMFSLHYRSVTTYEQKFLIYLVKLMTICLIAWGFQDYGLSWTMNQLKLNADRLTRITWETLAIITAIAVSTRVFTFPLNIMYRWILRSKLLMSKTTTRRSRSHGSHGSQGSPEKMAPRSGDDRHESHSPSDSHVTFTTNEPKSEAQPRTRKFSLKELHRKFSNPRAEQKPPDAKASGSKFNSKMSNTRKAQAEKKKPSARALDPRIEHNKSEPTAPGDVKKGKERRDQEISLSPVPLRRTSGSLHGSLASILRHLPSQDGRTSFLGQKPACSTIVIGPTLFRSVNTSPSIFKVRSRVNTWEARCSVGIFVVLFIVYFFYEERGDHVEAHYWNRRHVFLFFSLMTLLIDTVLLEPFFIFTKSLLAYSFFHMSNNDLNLWNKSAKIEVTEPRAVTWKEYMENATRKECKPILSSDLNMKRRQQRQLRLFQLSLLYMCMVGIAYNCYEQLVGRYAGLQRVYREAVKLTNSEPSTRLVNNSIGIEDVHSPKELLKYLITNFAIQTFTWSNGKRISMKAKFWDKARSSIPLMSTNMILLLMSSNKGNQSIPPRFLKYFRYPHTYYNRLVQETNSVYIDGFEWQYGATNNWTLVDGKSRDFYPMKGHTKVLSFRSWPTYYASLRSEVTAVMESKLIVPRAIVFTTNYFSPNLPGISTVDLVVEFLPTGICTGKLHIHVSRMYGIHRGLLYSSGVKGPPTLIFRLVTVILLIALMIFNVGVILKIGMKAYLTNFRWIFRALFLVSCLLNAFSSAFLLDVKYRKVHQILHDVESEYIDAHDMYDISDLYDQLFLGLILFFLGIEAMGVIHSMMSSERLARVFTKCMAVIFSITVIAVWIVSVISLAHDLRTFPLAIFVLTKNVLPVHQENSAYEELLPIIVVVVFILSKLCVAFVIQTYQASPDLKDKTDDMAEHITKEGICKHRAILTWLKLNGYKNNLPGAKDELQLTETKSKHPNTNNKPPPKHQQKAIDSLSGKLSLIDDKRTKNQ